MTGTARYSLLIHSGTIVDGTGSPGFRGAVAVDGDTVSILTGDVRDVRARTRIDASGKVVAPGFIDAHSHSDLLLVADPALEVKVRQGVTTEVVGVDGLSYAPWRAGELERFVRSNAGIAGMPAVGYDWSSIGDYLGRLDRRCAVNVATLVGNTPLRAAAVGWADEPATPAAVERMRGLAREAMEEGALGLSTGLDYPPGSHATTDELVALAETVAACGGIYHTHVRYSLGDGYLDPFREALEIGRRSGIGVHVTHFSRSARSSHRGGARAMLELLERAGEDGQDVTFDTYPYEWGGTKLVRLLPEWVQVDGPEALAERIGDPATRERLRGELPRMAAVTAYAASRPFADLRVGNLTDPKHLDLEGRFLAEVVAENGGDLTETLCELILANPAATFVRPAPHAMTLWRFVVHPLGMIASDSVFIGRYPSPRAYGTFPRVLGDFVREERLLSLPEAVRKMTSFPAQRLGLRGRGLLRDGMAADVVVFDPALVHATATYERPRTMAEGIEHVVVNGELVLHGGAMTGKRPGRALRGPAA